MQIRFSDRYRGTAAELMLWLLIGILLGVLQGCYFRVYGGVIHPLLLIYMVTAQ